MKKITFDKFNCTDVQKENIKIHIKFLLSNKLSGDFDMSFFTTAKAYNFDENICGTCACSAGYLPESLKGRFNLDSYYKAVNIEAELNFYSMICDLLGIQDSEEWDWCFSTSWTELDNSPQGAALRLQILFNKGLPSNWLEQLEGKEPLMYQNKLNKLIKK